MTRREMTDACNDARSDHLCDEDLVGCAVCDGLEEVEDELIWAAKIIESLKRGACWCDTVGHTPACIEAQRFMENAS